MHAADRCWAACRAVYVRSYARLRVVGCKDVRAPASRRVIGRDSPQCPSTDTAYPEWCRGGEHAPAAVPSRALRADDGAPERVLCELLTVTA